MSVMIPPQKLTSFEPDSEVEQRICQKVIRQLLRSQSASGFAASLDGQRSTSPKGIPIIGRNGQDETPSADPPIDPARIAALIQKLQKNAASTAACGEDLLARTENEKLACHPDHRGLGRSVSLPEDRLKTSGLKTMNMDRYKTELCRQFQETGFCKYGSKCQFAHGQHEIRSTTRHPKYKTELCRTYHTSGICPYGTRCHFIHDEDDLKLSAISYQKQQHVIDQIRQYRALQQQQQHYNRCSLSPTNSLTGFASRGFGVSALAASFVPDPAMSLGSAGDTPPSSLSSSPIPSPTCFLYEDSATMSGSAFPGGRYSSRAVAAPMTAPASVHNPFSFPDLGLAPDYSRDELRVPSPLDIQVPCCDPVASLAAGLQAAVPKADTDDLVMDCLRDFCMDASAAYDPAGDVTICDSPMDISRNLRLPVFSQLSKE